MKMQDRAFFLKQVQKQLPNIVLIMAPDQELKWLIEEICTFFKKQKIFYSTLTADTFTYDKFFQEVETIPFLAKKTALILTKVDQFEKKQIEEICTYLAKPNSQIILVLSGSGITASSKFYKECDKKGIVFHFKEKKTWELEKELSDFLIEEAGKEHVAMSQEVAKALVERIGSDRSFLVSELRKIICYIGERQSITLSDVEIISCGSRKATLFQLVDAILIKDLKKAYRVLRELLQEETSIHSLIASMRSLFQQNFEMFSLYRQGGYPAVKASFPYLQGRFLEKKMQGVIQFGEEGLKKGIVFLATAETDSKNSKALPQIILERLLIDLIT